MGGSNSAHGGKVSVRLLNEIALVVAWHERKG